MTGIAVRAVVYVIRIAFVLVVHRGFVVRMARQAGEDLVVRWIHVAVVAGGPFAGVLAGVNRETCVSKSGAEPARGVVARGARGGETRGDVIGIRHAGEILLVARIAGGGRALIYAGDVTVTAGHRGVLTGQRKRSQIVIVRRRNPSRGAVTHRTGGGEGRRSVIGIRRGIEVGQVTGDAGRIEPRIFSAGMAARAVQRNVRAGQREQRARMVEFRAQPLHRRMANGAVGRKSGRDVIRIGRFLKGGQMARIAILRRARVFPGEMTTAAACGNMRARKRENSEAVVEGCRDPRRGGVARGAGLRQAGRLVIRVGGAVVVVEMAGDARGVEAGISSADVARRARLRDVRTGQREASERMIELCAKPR